MLSECAKKKTDANQCVSSIVKAGNNYSAIALTTNHSVHFRIFSTTFTSPTAEG